MKSIKDIIYLDIEKSKSLISQLKGGVINEISKVFEEENTLEGELGLDIKIVKIGGKEFDTERTIKTEKVELFHEMINEIESQLKEVDSLSDLNELYKEFENDIETFFKLLPNLNYIKATGWANFEDYERFKNIYTNFNEIQRLIFHSVIIDNPEIVEIRKQLNDAKKNAKTNTNRNAVSKELAKITSLEKRFDIQLESLTGISLQDEDYIERMKIFLDTFSPNRLNFRLLPFKERIDFQILSNLKEKYIVDGNFENIIYTYGSKPNIKLSIIGIITSAPKKVDDRVNPNEEFDSLDDNLTEEQTYDRAFRNVFDSFENFEKFFFVPSYPKIAISPLAIYREILINKD